MGRCPNDALLSKITQEKLTNEIEVSFSLHKKLPDCRAIKASDYYYTDGTPTWNRFAKPESAYECYPDACTTTGTLTIPSSKVVRYYIPWDSADYSAGVVTFYVTSTSAATVNFKIGSDKDFGEDTFASYTVSVPANSVHYPVLIDLSKAGTGTWTPSVQTFIEIGSTTEIGVSTINVFESIYDFELDDVVKVGCLTTVGGSFDIESIERTCIEEGYQDDAQTFEYTVTGKSVTPNWWKLNPLLSKGEAVEGFKLRTVQEKVVSKTIDSATYGAVTLTDAQQDECGNLVAQVVDCDTIDAELKRVSIPFAVTLDEDQYQVIKNANGTTDVLFSAELIDMEVLISYPQIAKVKDFVATNDNLNTVRVRMSVPVKLKKGNNVVAEELHVFNNVLVTSFPSNLTGDETEFTFTITIQMDENNEFFHIYRIESVGQGA